MGCVQPSLRDKGTPWYSSSRGQGVRQNNHWLRINMPHETIEQDLKDMITLLESDGCEGWAAFFREAHDLLNQGMPAECARHIMSGSGGMGSLNDLVLGQEQDQHGQFQWKDGYKETNARYQELLNRLYEFGHRGSKRGRC